MEMSKYQDPYTDERVEELIAQVIALEEDEDALTWLDQDPSVAWSAGYPLQRLWTSPEESGFAKLRAIYLDAGWEDCYHATFQGGGAHVHYNVKVQGMYSYRGFHDALKKAQVSNEANARIEELAQTRHDGEISAFWEWELPDFLKELETSGEAWSCGRSSGYVNSPDLETDGEPMIRLAQYLERTKDWMNSYDHGKIEAEELIEEDQTIQMNALASPRIERIEA